MQVVPVSLAANAARDGADVRHMVHVNGWALAVMAGESEPELRIRDLDLGERLGFARPRDIRKLIRRYAEAGEISPVLGRATVSRPGNAGETEVIEYWLDEADALFIVAKSETPRANELTREIIRVYLLARRGMLPAQAAVPAEIVAIVRQLAEGQRQQGEVLASLAKRLDALESGGGVIGRVQRRAISEAVTRIARSRVHAGLAPSMASARRWAYTRLEAAAGWSGAGRSWDRLPASRFGLVLVELDVMQREVSAAMRAIANRQLALAIADNDKLETH